MMMMVLLISGTGFAVTLVREMFPESRPDQIEIRAIYPAVQPEELQKAIAIKVEESVEDIEGIEKIDSTVSEGMSRTVVTLYNEVKNLDAVLQEIKNEVDAIEDLPDDLEKITVRKMEPTLPVISVSIFGQGTEQQLKTAARELRDDLLLLPGVSDIQIGGTRDDEISVEIRPAKLLEYDVTFQEVANAIRQTNIDISGGTLKGDRSNVSVRTIGEELEGSDLKNIEVRSETDGRKILVSDVAFIRDEFVETDVESYFNGARAVNLTIQKTSSQDAIQIASLIKAYVAGKKGEDFDAYGFQAANKATWYQKPLSVLGAGTDWLITKVAGRPDPQAVYEKSLRTPFNHKFEVDMYSDLSRFVQGRLDLMLRNGKSGLILVMISLLLFLNWRVAVWSAIGLPVSFMGTFLVMWVFGVSINLLSMFGLIIVLGIIVDDAIVIGENIFRHIEEGMPAKEAAIKGAEEVMWPVIVAVTTTIAAFLPLMFIKGRIGDFMRELPLVVIAALSVSLIEAILILPAHLSRLPPLKKKDEKEKKKSLIRRFLKFDPGFLNDILTKSYETFLFQALKWRYITVFIAISSLMLSFGLFAGGIVKSEFIQEMDSETIIAKLDMPVGTVIDETKIRLIKASNFLTEEVPEVKSVQMHVGVQISVGGEGAVGASVQSHIGQLILELYEADERESKGMRSSKQLLAIFRDFTAKEIKGVNSLTWEAFNGGPAGKDIEMRISGDHFPDIVKVSNEITKSLNSFEGVVDLDDDYDIGKRELQLRLLDSANATGLTVRDLGETIRFALYGVEARRITRNREDVKIMVRYPRKFRKNVYNIETMWIPLPRGGETAMAVNSQNSLRMSNRRWVPIKEIAQLKESQSSSTIHRSQRKQSITIFGEVDSNVANLEDILKQFNENTLPKINQEYPNVRIESLGTSEERAKSFGSLRLAFPVALMMIYMLLAGLFRSYLQPIVVMSAIPFGIEGALIGHWITDNPFTILSNIGLVALAGILVNDSLVLVDFINSRVRKGMPVFQASLEGSKLRLRPILLTTLTTAAGLTPLMFETSFQAKFLIPMAVTLTFGLIFATALTLIIVPSLNLIYFDVVRVLDKTKRKLKDSDEEPLEPSKKPEQEPQPVG